MELEFSDVKWECCGLRKLKRKELNSLGLENCVKEVNFSVRKNPKVGSMWIGEVGKENRFKDGWDEIQVG